MIRNYERCYVGRVGLSLQQFQGAIAITASCKKCDRCSTTAIDSRLQVGEVQIILRAWQCHAPTRIGHLREICCKSAIAITINPFLCSNFRVPGINCRVPVINFRVNVSVFRVPRINCRVPRINFRVNVSVFHVPRINFRVPVINIRVNVSVFCVPRINFRVLAITFNVNV
ncbi:hypothetical protein NIES2107_65750 [Nostoc carneum NIES-2107]|nr:hypothetical protein NIES2107_65750 [Nostoc carneum NIES-2107]